MSGSNKILIVDDEPSMLITLTDILIISGYNVSTVEDGYQALELVKKEKYAVVLMDFNMPGMNGVETFNEIAKIDPGIKCIFITAYYDESVLSKALSEGIGGICHKPLNIPLLLDFIKTAVG